MHMRATPSPATDSGTPDVEVPNKSDVDSIPVCARGDGTDDIRGMVTGLLLTCDVSLPHAFVGVVTIALVVTMDSLIVMCCDSAQSEKSAFT